jgi:hypothetical protein
MSLYMWIRIPSIAAMRLFSALALLGTHAFLVSYNWRLPRETRTRGISTTGYTAPVRELPKSNLLYVN